MEIIKKKENFNLFKKHEKACILHIFVIKT